MKIEPAFHERVRIAFEISPFVEIGEAGGGDARPCRKLAQSAAIRLAERPIDYLEFIVLVFAHCYAQD
ncbi:hypothetical protein AB6802_27500 [Mesorhizobium sp. RCC_202]|uniref:hypothetical protein n=1 Tax=Mesorhizobium sp. RCC_202 TaxID=3239222 RepID=UPI0035231A00